MHSRFLRALALAFCALAFASPSYAAGFSASAKACLNVVQSGTSGLTADNRRIRVGVGGHQRADRSLLADGADDTGPATAGQPALRRHAHACAVRERRFGPERRYAERPAGRIAGLHAKFATSLFTHPEQWRQHRRQARRGKRVHRPVQLEQPRTAKHSGLADGYGRCGPLLDGP
jgi:hypothetical protein